MPTISVIIGAYNCAATLPEALDSLYAQSYKDFDIIICDDGSSDNTHAICEEYCKTKDNVQLLKNNRNMGLNYTLNRCLSTAYRGGQNTSPAWMEMMCHCLIGFRKSLIS